MDAGADIMSRGDDGATCLYSAALFNQPEMVAFLCARGADVNCQNNTGIAPLHLAATDGNIKLIQVLVEGKL